MHRVECENHADAADYTGSDDARVGKFGVQAENAEDQQDEENVGLDDAGKKFLAGGKFKRDTQWICERDGRLVSDR